ncbi:MAG: sensor histidine kinase [Bacteroidetes bacterium]|nr:sensor histidine kinase [Bacteroidota bacterium]
MQRYPRGHGRRYRQQELGRARKEIRDRKETIPHFPARSGATASPARAQTKNHHQLRPHRRRHRPARAPGPPHWNFRQKRALQQQRIAELEIEKQLHFTEAVLKGEEQERTRLAKDLHDGLGGMLSGIKYGFNNMKGNLILTPETAQAFERSMDMLDSSIREMRRVAHNMMPEALVKFGLNTALKDFCNDITGSGALTVTYQSMGLEDGKPIDQTTSITIYRIVQELINNSLKHASAKTAIVQVSRGDNDTLSITVEDDGKGFDTTALKTSGGIGWTSITNRVEFLKGKWDIQSTPGKGTSVLIEIPLTHVN